MNKSYLKLTAFLFLFLFNRTFGQNIPDANFAAAIRAACPTCIDGSNNLTSLAKDLTTLNVSNKNISDLTGIIGFEKLKIFHCDTNNITTIPTLPSSITELWCEVNQIASLPILHEGMNILGLKSNKLISIPALPSTLTQLWCEDNQITSLPTLHNGITILGLKNNNLSYLPALPNTLTRLNINQNHITSLPPLPNTLESLSAYSNNLTSLPSPLPTNLQVFGVNSNQLTSIPDIPSSVYFLDCNANSGINSIPSLPNGLKTLIISGTHISSFTVLPNGLQTLDISSTNITCLPTLPNTLTSLTTTSTGITCIPNKPSGLTTSLPICNSGGGCTLPLELTDFQLFTLDNNIKITWTTSSESNLSDFTLERSDDNGKYYPLSIQQPKGDLASISHYSFIDENPNNVNYYRLKINEKDGTFSYSKILSAVLNKQKNALAYPNPFRNTLRIKTTGTNLSENMHIQLMDITGRMYISKIYDEGEIIDTQDIPKGIYIVSILQGSEMIKMKMIKE
jgi:Secretion system C-terminal sorting domain